jgi:hypothetical protein
MIQKVKIILLFLLLITLSCSKGQKKYNALPVIDIEANMKNMQQINLSQFTSEIKYVPLQIRDNLAFVGIWDCEFSDKYILVKDIKKCFLYDFEGNVIAKIGNQGRGPGEYRYAINVEFGPNNKIYIQDLYDLLEYNMDGSFFKKYEKCFLVNNELIGSWFPMTDSLIFGKISSLMGNEKNKAVIFNNNGVIKAQFKNYILFNRGRQLAGPEERSATIYKFNSEIVFKEIYNDTIFNLSKELKLIPKYLINLGKFSEPVSQRESITRETMSLHFSTIWENYMQLKNVFQTKNYLILDCEFNVQFPAKRLTPKTIMNGITSWYNTTRVLGIYDKQTKKLIFCKPTSTDNSLFTSGLYNDIDAGARFFPKTQVNDSTMVMSIEAKQLKDHVASTDFKNIVAKYPEKKQKLEELANRLTEFDNPVLMFVTIKK